MTINWNYSEFIIGGSTMTLIGDVVLNPDETFVAVKNSNIFVITSYSIHYTKLYDFTATNVSPVSKITSPINIDTKLVK